MMLFSGEFAGFFGKTKFHGAIYLFRTIADPKHNIIRIDIFILPKLIDLPPRFFRALRPIPIFLTRCQSTRRILQILPILNGLIDKSSAIIPKTIGFSFFSYY